MMPGNLRTDILVPCGEDNGTIRMNRNQLELLGIESGQSMKFTRQIEVLRVPQLKDFDMFDIACSCGISHVTSVDVVNAQRFHIVLQRNIRGVLVEGMLLLLHSLVFAIEDLLFIVDHLQVARIQIGTLSHAIGDISTMSCGQRNFDFNISSKIVIGIIAVVVAVQLEEGAVSGPIAAYVTIAVTAVN